MSQQNNFVANESKATKYVRSKKTCCAVSSSLSYIQELIKKSKLQAFHGLEYSEINELQYPGIQIIFFSLLKYNSVNLIC